MINQENNEDSLELCRKYIEISEFYIQVLQETNRCRNNCKIYMEECSQMDFIMLEQITAINDILNQFEKLQYLIVEWQEGQNEEQN